MSVDKLQDVFDYIKAKGGQMIGDIAGIRRGEAKEKDRPTGICYACKRFAKGAMIHESPGTAKCCAGCDAAEVEK